MGLIDKQAASNAVRALKEHNIDISQVTGTGLGGRVTKADILAYMDRAGGGSASRPATPTRVFALLRPYPEPFGLDPQKRGSVRGSGQPGHPEAPKRGAIRGSDNAQALPKGNTQPT